jgi:riboflavin kinase/FMN adenylyltransferase
MRRLRVIKGWKDLPPGDRGAAVAMGSFDGVHRGHQQVIALSIRTRGSIFGPMSRPST